MITYDLEDIHAKMNNPERLSMLFDFDMATNIILRTDQFNYDEEVEDDIFIANEAAHTLIEGKKIIVNSLYPKTTKCIKGTRLVIGTKSKFTIRLIYIERAIHDALKGRIYSPYVDMSIVQNYIMEFLDNIVSERHVDIIWQIVFFNGYFY